MAFIPRKFGLSLLVCLSLASAERALAHGDVTPQPVDTTGLAPVGNDWLEKNPYRGNELALKIGHSGFAQNCARCHGIEAESGGIAPDLRYLDKADAALVRMFVDYVFLEKWGQPAPAARRIPRGRWRL